MNIYNVPTLNKSTSKGDQDRLIAALKSVPGVENATLRLGSSEVEIKPRANHEPKRDMIAAASQKAGFTVKTKPVTTSKPDKSKK
jgi:hypothetical protein